MKKLLIAFIGIFFLATTTAEAKRSNTATTTSYTFNESISFVEEGVTFSVYNDGEFDFFINRLQTGVSGSINAAGVSISFNSGYDYNPYIQYDDYGAVVQIENTPIFYDYYGRVYRIGNVLMNYDGFGNLIQVGGLYVYYDTSLRFSHTSGYITPFNRSSRRFAFYNSVFFRPGISLCLVNLRPYRRFYTPIRYSYCSPYRNNYRYRYARARIGHEYRSFARANTNRRSVYRNDRRVTRRNDAAVYNTRRTVTRTSTRNTRSAMATRNNTRNQNTRSTTRNNVRSTTRNNTRLSGVRSSNTNTGRIEKNTTRATRNNNNVRATNNTRATTRTAYTRNVKPARTTRNSSSRATRSSQRKATTQRSNRSQKKTSSGRQRNARKRS